MFCRFGTTGSLKKLQLQRKRPALIHPSVTWVPPLILIKHMTLATYVGTTGPSTVFEPILFG